MIRFIVRNRFCRPSMTEEGVQWVTVTADVPELESLLRSGGIDTAHGTFDGYELAGAEVLDGDKEEQ